MTLPTARTTEDSITAEITGENARFLDALVLLNFVSPFNRYKKGVGNKLGQLHQFDVVHARGAVYFNVDRSSRGECDSCSIFYPDCYCTRGTT